MKHAPAPARWLPVMIYVLPAIADMVASQLFFINAVRLARMGASASVVANTITTWSIVYLLTCPVIGRFLTPSNAGRMIVFSMAMLTGMSLLAPFISGVLGIYCFMAIAGIATALFFVPFQVFMKAVDGLDNRSIAYSTGLYTFSWSLGFACGPFVSGLLMELGTPERPGWIYACWFAAGASALTGVGGYVLKRLIMNVPRPPATTPVEPTPPPVDYSGRPDLAWLGWISAGAGMLALTFFRGIFPSLAESTLHLSQSFQGFLFFLLSLAQALTGLFLCRSRFWMYRMSGVFALGLAGIAGSLVFGFARGGIMLGLGALLFGLYAGGFFFYMVFHALAHSRNSGRYVAINEMVIGLSSLAGALVGGWIADQFGFGALYTLGAALIAVTLAVQGIALRRIRG
jgi:ACDE family multidrug resistance protein